MDNGTQEQNVIQMPAKKFFIDPANFSYSKEVRDLIPEVDPNFIVSGSSEGFISLVRMRSQMEGINVRLVGPAGCGKTSFATHYAAISKLPCLIMDCANVREPRDWFGYRTLDPVTKEIVWHESLFIKMIETPGTVIVLDELNRVSPLIVNTLIPLLDHRRATYLEEALRLEKELSGVLMEHYGDILFRLGKVDDAVSWWKKAKESPEGSDELAQKIKDRQLHD